MLSAITWDPDRNLFVIPYVDHPITWYGFLFALGFLFSFFLIRKMFSIFLKDPSKNEFQVNLEAVHLTDRLAVLVVFCGIIGARLGHVFLYDWTYYKSHPKDIFKIWEGGLASHGGAVGILIAIFIFALVSHRQTPRLTFLAILDALVVPVAFVGGCIRIGNFINQEITGTPTNVFCGVVFMHPLDGLPGVAVHPVQLYESFFYFFVFIFLFLFWKKTELGLGKLSGWFFILVFGFRFVIEFFKMPQNEVFDVEGYLTMGQLLSIPFFFFGIFLLLRCYTLSNKKHLNNR